MMYTASTSNVIGAHVAFIALSASEAVSLSSNWPTERCGVNPAGDIVERSLANGNARSSAACVAITPSETGGRDSADFWKPPEASGLPFASSSSSSAPWPLG